jgi:hypothetical protein
MGYVTYNHSLQQTGFRPYGKTNTFAATQLSGVADTAGLGQNYPFTPGGGWQLHGLGDLGDELGEDLGDLGETVPNASVVTYQGQWIVTNVATQKPADILAAVTAALVQDGLLVLRSSTDAGFWSTEVLGHAFNVTLQLQVNNGMGYGQPSDIVSIIRHEVYAVSGAMPQSDQITVNSVPGGGASPIADLTALQDWSTWLQENAAWIGLTVAGLVIVPTLVRRLL